ncbi:hypothetical protein BDFB_004310 [Asbolus verrucosus]|uniref:Uncharacterized protein n=1 Tax=Asbolus verrucosus TaxID=1661398 RepID=A0A482VRD3_ASBVE|nr:hypothetical protein BDFB_004310 [Asbolus verrucosus]
MEIDTDSSYYYETTYSEDERIEKALTKRRKARKQRAKIKNLTRQRLFKDLSGADLEIFTLPGLKFHAFRHTKIKFSFEPSKISNLVVKSVIFYISLIYKGNNWRVKRDSLPGNYKWKIYKLFYNQTFFAIDDENIFQVLMKIYEIMVTWTKNEENFRLDKFERYKKNEDVELDSDDEQLFLSENERVQIFQKKLKILRRMLPPLKRK